MRGFVAAYRFSKAKSEEEVFVHKKSFETKPYQKRTKLWTVQTLCRSGTGPREIDELRVVDKALDMLGV